MKHKEATSADSGAYYEYKIITTGIYSFMLRIAKKFYGFVKDRRLL